MKYYFLKCLIMSLALSSCAITNRTFDKKEYRKSKALATYTGMANELQDGYLVLKENGYFKFYQKLWLIVSIKQVESIGRYSKMHDTLYLTWMNSNSNQTKYYLSRKCVVDSATKSLWFIDEVTHQRLWKLGLISKK